MPRPEQLNTWDGRYTIEKWWDLMIAAQEKRGQIELLRGFVSENDLVFDIGASRGSMTLLFRQLGCRVIAVDPLLTYFDEFGWKWDDDEMVTPVPLGVSDIPGQRTFRFRRGIPWISSIDQAWYTKSAHARFYRDRVCDLSVIHVVTLDNLIEKYGIPRFIKIDVEGHENYVIAGLSQPVNGLSLEFHEDWIPWAALVRLSEMANYEFNYSLNRTETFVMDEWIDHVTLVDYMRAHLTKEGDLSWGDIYARQI